MTNPYSSAPGPVPYAPQPYNPNAPTNGLAIASFVVSILGLSIIGVVLGHIAISQVRARNERGSGFAVAGVALGYAGCLLWLIFWAVIVVISIYTGTAISNYENYNY